MANPREIKTTLSVDAQGVERGAKAASRSISAHIKKPLQDVAAAARVTSNEIATAFKRGPAGHFLKKDIEDYRKEWRALGKEVASVQDIMRRTKGGRQKLSGLDKFELGVSRAMARGESNEDTQFNESVKAKNAVMRETKREAKALGIAWDNARKSKHALQVNVKEFIPILRMFGGESKGVAQILGEEFVSALESSDRVFDRTFNASMVSIINSIVKSMEKGIPASRDLGKAFDQSFRTADAATKELKKDFDNLATSLSKSETFQEFSLPVEAAKTYLQELEKTKSESEALRRTRQQHLTVEQELQSALRGVTQEIERQRIAALRNRAEAQKENLARKGKLNPDIANAEESTRQAAQLNRNYFATINPMAAAQQAFNRTLAETIAKNKGVADVAYALTSAQAAYKNSLKNVDDEAKKLSKTFNLTAAQSKVLLEALRDQVPVMEALDRATGKVSDKFAALNSTARAMDAVKKAFNAPGGNLGTAMKAGIQEERLAAIELNKQVDFIRQNFKMTAQQASIVAEKIAAGVPPGQALAEATKRVGYNLSALSRSGAGNQAFNNVLSRTGNIAHAVSAGLGAAGRAKGILEKQAKRLGKELKGVNVDFKVLLDLLAKNVPFVEAFDRATKKAAGSLRIFGMTLRFSNNGLSTANERLSKVGELFTGLFVVDRIVQSLKGFMGWMIGLAKVGAEYETQMISLAITGKKLGIEYEDIKGAMKDVTDGFISNETAAVGLRTLLQTGIGLERATKLMDAFENSTLRTNLTTKDFQARLTAGIEGVYDRQSRKVGNMTSLQTNFGQALKLSEKDIRKYLTATEQLTARAELFGKTQTLVGESLRFYAALMAEARLATGLLAVATQTTQGQLAIFDKNVRNLKVSLGLALAPILGSLAMFMNTQILPALGEWIDNNQDLIRSIAVISGIMASFVILLGTVATAIISISFAISLSPIGMWTILILALIGTLGTLMVAMNGAKGSAKLFAESFAIAFETVRTAAPIFKLFGTALNFFFFAFKNLGEGAALAGKAIADFFYQLVSWVPDLEKAHKQVHGLNEEFDKTKSIFDRAAMAKAFEVTSRALTKALNNWQNVNMDQNREEVHAMAMAVRDLAEAGKAIYTMPERMEEGKKKAAEALDAIYAGFNRIINGLDIEAVKDPWVQFGNAATDTANKCRDAAAQITQNLLSLRESLNGIIDSMRGELSDAIFPEGEFDRKLNDFDAKFRGMMRSMFAKVEMKDIGFSKAIRDLEEQLAAARMDPAQYTEILMQQGELNIEFEKHKAVLEAITVEYGTMENALNELQRVIREVFIAKEIDKALASMRSFQSLAKETRRVVDAAEGRNIARLFSQRMEALTEMAKHNKDVEENLQKIRLDYEKQANLEILRARSELFNDLETIALAFGEILKDSVKDFFGLFNAGTENIRKQQLALKISERRDRADELINQVNETAKSEKERQARIIEIQRRASNDIRSIQAIAAMEVENRWQVAFKRLANVIRDTFVGTFVDKMIKQQLVPAIAGLFGSGAKALLNGKLTVTLGKTMDDAMAKIIETPFQENWLKEYEELKGINQGIKNLTNKIFDIQDEQPPKGEGTKGPITLPEEVVKANQTTKETTKNTEGAGRAMEGFRKVLMQANVALGALAGLYALFGDEMPKALKSLLVVISAVNLALTIYETITKALTVAKTAEAAADTAKTVTTVASTAAVATNTSAVAASTAGALATVGPYLLIAAAVVGVILLLPKLTKVIGNAIAAIAKFIVGLVNALADIAKAIANFVQNLLKAIGDIAGGLLKGAGSLIGGIFKGIGGFFGGIFGSGGVVKKTTAAIVGESGPEAILPLNASSMRMLGNAIIKAQGGSQMAPAGIVMGGGGGGLNMNFNISTGGDPALAAELKTEIEKTVFRVVKRSTIGMGGIA